MNDTPKQTADEIRSKLVAQFELFKPALQQFQEYSTRAAALNQEYHMARLEEVLGLVPRELTLVATFDGRETPATLDTKLANLRASGAVIKEIIFNRKDCTFNLYV